MSFKFPYTNYQELNLDWMLKRVKELITKVEHDTTVVEEYENRLVIAENNAENALNSASLAEITANAANNTAGTALGTANTANQKADNNTNFITLLFSIIGNLSNLLTPHKDNLVNAINDAYNHGGGGGGAVDSVNGQTGIVVLTASDVGALPDSYTAPVESVNGKTGAVTLTASDVGALPDSYTAPVTSVNGNTGAVTVDELPPVTVADDGKILKVVSGDWSVEAGGGGAVDSVNGQTGTVVLTASDVGALPDSYTAPVTSVNQKTGNVTLYYTDRQAIAAYGWSYESSKHRWKFTNNLVTVSVNNPNNVCSYLDITKETIDAIKAFYTDCVGVGCEAKFLSTTLVLYYYIYTEMSGTGNRPIDSGITDYLKSIIILPY